MNFKSFVSELIESNTKNIVSIENQVEHIEKLSKEIIKAKANNRKDLIFGNGGSASMAQHFAAELLVRFKKDRETEKRPIKLKRKK